jgi:hypothetical protein
MALGITGLLATSFFGGGALMRLICPIFFICLPYYLRFLTLFVVFLGCWLGYEVAGFILVLIYFPYVDKSASSFTGSI